MKMHYYRDTDSLYIELTRDDSVENREVAEGVVLDYGANGELVGIDIDNASRRTDLERLVLTEMPGHIETRAA